MIKAECRRKTLCVNYANKKKNKKGEMADESIRRTKSWTKKEHVVWSEEYRGCVLSIRWPNQTFDN